MTMREKPPGENHEPDVVVDAPDDARGYNHSAWTGVRIIFWILAGLLVLASLLWLGQIFGLMAAVLPGGTDPLGAALWGGAGVVGLALLIILIRAARESRGASD
jgi:hypothetical protein